MEGEHWRVAWLLSPAAGRIVVVVCCLSESWTRQNQILEMEGPGWRSSVTAEVLAGPQV